MRILFDHGVPRGLVRELPGFAVTRAKAMGWDQLANGELLKAAERAEFDILLTTDRRIRYQQNLAGRKIAIVVLSGSTKWTRVQLCREDILTALQASGPGSYVEVFVPFERRGQRPL